MAAQLETSIEKELLERLQKGVYPTDIVNINMKEYEKVRQTCIAVSLGGWPKIIIMLVTFFILQVFDSDDPSC